MQLEKNRIRKVVLTHSTTLPKWAVDILHANGLGFEVTGLHDAIWNHYLDEFPPEQFEGQLHIYFPYFVQERSKSGWVQALKTQIKNRNRVQQKRVKQSPHAVFQKKVENYFKHLAQCGDIVEFLVTVRCTHCRTISKIGRSEYDCKLFVCTNCKNHIKL